MNVAVRLALDTLVWPALPVVAAAGAARTLRGKTSETALGALAAVAVAAGIALAHLIDAGVPHLPPIDTIGWIPIAVAASALALLARGATARTGAVLVVMTLAAWKIGRPVWPGAAGLVPWPLAIGVATAAVSAALDRSSGAADRVSPVSTQLALALAMAAGALACLFGHSALLAQLLGASAAVTGAAALAALVAPPGRAVTAIALVAFASVLLYARLFATARTPVLLLLTAAALSPALAAALPFSRRARNVIAVSLALALAAASVLSAR